MRVSSVSYGFTKNLGNFQSQRVDATVKCGDNAGDNFDDALILASAVVNEALGLPIGPEQGKALREERDRAALEAS
jgi:hypothetical protein